MRPGVANSSVHSGELTMPKNKALAVIEGFADECVISGSRENVLRIRLNDGSFCGDVCPDVLMNLLQKKKATTSQRPAGERPAK